MKLFRRARRRRIEKEEQDNLIKTQMREKLQVEILGKGSHPVSVDETTTVRDLRDILNVGSQVQAFDESGTKLSNDELVLDVKSNSSNSTGGDKKISFIPNVKGGVWKK